MDRQEAANIAGEVIGELQAVPYDTLVARLLSEVETRLVIGSSSPATDRWWVRSDDPATMQP